MELRDGEPGQQLTAKFSLEKDQNYFTLPTSCGSQPPGILAIEAPAPIFASLGTCTYKSTNN